jgi:hypothetical protein
MRWRRPPMEKDNKDNKEKFVTLVNTPGGFFTPSMSPPAKTGTKKDLDEIVDSLLKDVDVPLSARKE